jgi:integrase
MRRKLTDLFIKRVRPEDGRSLYWDDDPKRLALSVRPSGRKSFKLVYSFNGRMRWYHIGDADSIGLAEARKIAKKLEGQIAGGIDPQYEKRKALVAARLEGTFEGLAQRYVEEHAKQHNKSWEQTDLLVRRHLLPKWGRLKVRDITRTEVKALFRQLTSDGAPMLANQVVAAASAIFSWTIAEEDADLSNPCRGVRRNPTQSRERVLSDAEVPIFWNAFDEAGLVPSSALKMILLTGQRPGEVRHMRWEHLEIGTHRFTDANGRTFEAEGAWWTLPGLPDPALGWPGTKNAQTHRVWLPQAAVAILEEVDADGEDRRGFVFAGQRSRAFHQLAHAMARICDKVGIAKSDKVTPHDLRRTHGTTVTSLGFTRDQMNRLQNHKEGGIASVYDRHSYADENRRIQEAVAGKLMSLIEGGAAEGKVVPLHA